MMFTYRVEKSVVSFRNKTMTYLFRKTMLVCWYLCRLHALLRETSWNYPVG